jgi:hypothetical protein
VKNVKEDTAFHIACKMQSVDLQIMQVLLEKLKAELSTREEV